MAVRSTDELREWLEEQSRETCVALIYRMAMRELPLSLVLNVHSGGDAIALIALRAAFTAGVYARNATSEVSAAGISASKIAYRTARDNAPSGNKVEEHVSRTLNTMSDASKVLEEHRDKAISAGIAKQYLCQNVMERELSNTKYLSDSVRQVFDDVEIEPIHLVTARISVSKALDDALSKELAGYELVLDAGVPWAFWAEWYAREMAGDPLPWKLQEQIALIPNEIWEAGPEAVAEEIERIEAEFELRARIEAVEADQVLVQQQRLGIGGNNPPEEIDDPVVAENAVILWDSIAGLREEVDANEPDAARVAYLIDRLGAALKAIMLWCGRKADLVVDTTIKWAIPAGGTGYLYFNPAKAEAVLKAAQAWLPFLAP